MGRFLVDQMCGSLARHLRFCGHDTAYAPDRDITADRAIIEAAHEDDRTVITRDRALAADAEDAILVTAHDIEGQLASVAEAGYPLELADEPTRCGRCNGRLERRPSAAATPGYVPDDLDGPVFACRDCNQYFWRGSHWEAVAKTLERVRSATDA